MSEQFKQTPRVTPDAIPETFETLAINAQELVGRAFASNDAYFLPSRYTQIANGTHSAYWEYQAKPGTDAYERLAVFVAPDFLQITHEENDMSLALPHISSPLPSGYLRTTVVLQEVRNETTGLLEPKATQYQFNGLRTVPAETITDSTEKTGEFHDKVARTLSLLGITLYSQPETKPAPVQIPVSELLENVG